jgi:uncharacterized protein (DUF1330 family)
MSAYVIVEFTIKAPKMVTGQVTNSPEYQQLIDVRNVAMDARFSLLDGLPTRTEDERESE